jgi:hypothetical protein
MIATIALGDPNGENTADNLLAADTLASTAIAKTLANVATSLFARYWCFDNAPTFCAVPLLDSTNSPSVTRRASMEPVNWRLANNANVANHLRLRVRNPEQMAVDDNYDAMMDVA